MPAALESIRKNLLRRAALEDTCDLDFYDEPLNEVIAAIAQRHRIQIHVDRKALETEQVSANSLITRTLRGITLRAALKLMLEELDLAYVVRNEVLLVTSQTKAEKLLVVKVYPVFDLVVRRRGSSRLKPALDFESLIEAITTNLAPTTWDNVGATGEIEAFTNAGALVISQTPRSTNKSPLSCKPCAKPPRRRSRRWSLGHGGNREGIL